MRMLRLGSGASARGRPLPRLTAGGSVVVVGLVISSALLFAGYPLKTPLSHSPIVHEVQAIALRYYNPCRIRKD